MLLVQSWVVPGSELHLALRDGGYRATIIRVDFEPALAAALSRSTYDVIVLDSVSSGLSRETVESMMRDHGIRTPLVVLGELAGLVDAIRSARAGLRN